MDNQPLHLLTKLGVLSSFSISKKITEREIDMFMAEGKMRGRTEDEMIQLLREKLIKEIVDATRAGLLPGIILDKTAEDIIPIKKIESLNKMVSILTDRLKSKKIDTLSLCYFINHLVNNLGLTEEDFENFHRKIKEAGMEDDDDDDDLHGSYDYE